MLKGRGKLFRTSAQSSDESFGWSLACKWNDVICSTLPETSLGQEQACGDTWHPCQVFSDSELRIGLWKMLFMSNENASREIWVLEIHLQLMQGIGFLWENLGVRSRPVVVLMGNSMTAVLPPSSSERERHDLALAVFQDARRLWMQNSAGITRWAL